MLLKGKKMAIKFLVILNLSKQPQQFTWKDQPSEKEWNNVFAGNKEPVDKGFGIEPWGYAVYEIRKIIDWWNLLITLTRLTKLNEVN